MVCVPHREQSLLCYHKQILSSTNQFRDSKPSKLPELGSEEVTNQNFILYNTLTSIQISGPGTDLLQTHESLILQNTGQYKIKRQYIKIAVRKHTKGEKPFLKSRKRIYHWLYLSHYLQGRILAKQLRYGCFDVIILKNLRQKDGLKMK